jgi:hypothetical protein
VRRLFDAQSLFRANVGIVRSLTIPIPGEAQRCLQFIDTLRFHIASALLGMRGKGPGEASPLFSRFPVSARWATLAVNLPFDNFWNLAWLALRTVIYLMDRRVAEDAGIFVVV